MWVVLVWVSLLCFAGTDATSSKTVSSPPEATAKKLQFNALMEKAAAIEEVDELGESLALVSSAYKSCPQCVADKELLEKTAEGNNIVQTLHHYDNYPERRWLMERMLPLYVRKRCKANGNKLTRVLWVGIELYTLRYEPLIKLIGNTIGCHIDVVQLELDADKAALFSSFSSHPVLHYDVTNVEAIRKEQRLHQGSFDLIVAFGVKYMEAVSSALQTYNYLLKPGGIGMIHEQDHTSACVDALGTVRQDAKEPFEVETTYEYVSQEQAAQIHHRVFLLKKLELPDETSPTEY